MYNFQFHELEKTESSGGFIMKRHKPSAILIVYIIFFYVAWTVFELIAKNALDNTIKNAVLCSFIKSAIIKNLVWTLPAILLIRHFESEVYITLREMFTIKFNWLEYMPIFIAFTVYVMAGSILHHGKPEIVPSFGVDKIIIVLFVGLTEEMVFRGWLLNFTICENKKWSYIIANAIMFLAIHFPKWISSGRFLSGFTSLQFLEIMALSIVFSLTFIRSKNILVPISLHMYYDLLVFMLI